MQAGCLLFLGVTGFALVTDSAHDMRSPALIADGVVPGLDAGSRIGRDNTVCALAIKGLTKTIFGVVAVAL